MDRLMDKLVKAKAIMDKSENIKTSDIANKSINYVQEFDSPNVKYNIPQEFLAENQPVTNTKPLAVPTVDAIKNSKLPDEIKKLMIEHPIAQPNQQTQVTLSDDLIERASRLMGNNNSEKTKIQETQNTKSQTSDINYKLIQKMIEEAVNKALKENGLLVESTEKSNENFSFRVGKHVFEGKISKVKKIV
jgi:hypothetical protein